MDGEKMMRLSYRNSPYFIRDRPASSAVRKVRSKPLSAARTQKGQLLHAMKPHTEQHNCSRSQRFISPVKEEFGNTAF